jgi:hypothetical protein
MPRFLSRWLRRSIRGWHALAGLGLFLLFAATALPIQSSRVRGNSPDTAFLYSAGDLTRMAAAYGVEGRAAYVRSRWTFDLAFPMIYGFFLAASIAWLLGRALPAGSPWQRLNLVPLAAVAFDLLENIMATVVMRAYPAPAPLAATLAPVMSALKWVFVGASFAALAMAASLALWRRSRTKRRA